MDEFLSLKNSKDRAIKKASTFNEIIPSEDLSELEYMSFLSLAKPYELELDVISQETLYKICKELNQPLPKPQFPSPRKVGPL